MGVPSLAVVMLHVMEFTQSVGSVTSVMISSLSLLYLFFVQGDDVHRYRSWWMDDWLGVVNQFDVIFLSWEATNLVEAVFVLL